MRNQLTALLLALLLAVSVTACGGKEDGTSLDLENASWEEILDAARGTTVTFYGWGGDENRNNWLNTAVADYVQEEYGVTLGVVGMKEVAPQQIGKYSSLAVEPLEERVYKVTDMVEKPSPDKVLSLFSILGRCVLPAEVFSILAETPPGAGGELQLTDAMKVLARSQGMTGVDYVGTRYDMGSKLGVLQAIVEVGVDHPEIGEGFREYLREFCKKL